MSTNGFQIGCITVDILDIIPNNTPVEILQGIYFDDQGNEIITDGEALIKNKWQLWLWLHEIATFYFVEFQIPGGITWQLNHQELRVKCQHPATLSFWIGQVLDKLNIEISELSTLRSEQGAAPRLLISRDLKQLQLS
jgi:hypothetical protein